MKYYDFSLKIIDVSCIDFNFTPFSFSFGFELEHIITSIQKVGLINSPILKEDKERFIIVSGYKRLLALKTLGWDRVGGRIIGEEIPFWKCLLINLYDNISVRALNHVEKAILLSRLCEYFPPHQIIEEYMPLLGLPRYKPLLDLYLWIDREVEDDVKILVAQDKLSIKNLRLCFERDISKEDLKTYTYIFNNLRLNFNQQRQFIEYSNDICRERNISLNQFLEDFKIKDIIENNTLSVHDKIRKIMNIIREKRFPNLYEAEARFYNKIKGLNIPEGVAVKAPLYFESPYYKMEISFKNGAELMEKISKLFKIKGLEEIGNPWEKQ